VSTSSGVLVRDSVGILVRIVVGVGNWRGSEVPPRIKVFPSVRISHQTDGGPCSLPFVKYEARSSELSELSGLNLLSGVVWVPRWVILDVVSSSVEVWSLGVFFGMRSVGLFASGVDWGQFRR